MFRRHSPPLSRRGTSPLRNLRAKQKRLQGTQFSLERLEDRHLLAGDTLAIGLAPPLPQLPQPSHAQSLIASGADVPSENPLPLNQTFLLHSDPTATKTVYLDFDGFITRGTDWNTLSGLPNIVTPAFSLDGDNGHFSDVELTAIQLMWEQVSEDYRPFDVDVTTADPGVEALRNTGGADDHWGIRVVVGGSALDWLQPTTGMPNPGIAYIGSFTCGYRYAMLCVLRRFRPILHWDHRQYRTRLQIHCRSNVARNRSYAWSEPRRTDSFLAIEKGQKVPSGQC